MRPWKRLLRPEFPEARDERLAMPKFKITVGLLETRSVFKTYERVVEAPSIGVARVVAKEEFERDILEDPNLEPKHIGRPEYKRDIGGSCVTEIP